MDQLFQSLFPFSFINCGIAYSITYSSVTSSPSTYYLLRTRAITHYIWKPYENIQMLTITYFSFSPLWFEHDIKSMTISIFILWRFQRFHSLRAGRGFDSQARNQVAIFWLKSSFCASGPYSIVHVVRWLGCKVRIK